MSHLILVLEDTDSVRILLQEALTEAGYAVLAAASAEETLQLLAERGAGVQALVADVILDGISAGWEVARRAREMSSGMVVVYVTGGAGHEWKVEGVLGSVLISKPFVLAELIATVAGLLTCPYPPQSPA